MPLTLDRPSFNLGSNPSLHEMEIASDECEKRPEMPPINISVNLNMQMPDIFKSRPNFDF